MQCAHAASASRGAGCCAPSGGIAGRAAARHALRWRDPLVAATTAVLRNAGFAQKCWVSATAARVSLVGTKMSARSPSESVPQTARKRVAWPPHPARLGGSDDSHAGDSDSCPGPEPSESLRRPPCSDGHIPGLLCRPNRRFRRRRSSPEPAGPWVRVAPEYISYIIL